jgi:hypothetical protein
MLMVHHCLDEFLQNLCGFADIDVDVTGPRRVKTEGRTCTAALYF